MMFYNDLLVIWVGVVVGGICISYMIGLIKFFSVVLIVI